MSVPVILLLVLLALLLLIAALLFLPVWVSVELRHSRLTVRLRVLFLTFTLLPAREKKKKYAKVLPPLGALAGAVIVIAAV